MKVLGVIPARWASSRFPGKPLVKIGEKSMIQRVYEQSRKALDFVVVATDDERIVREMNKFGGQVVMTSPEHQSGTDRCFEALNIIETSRKIKFDIVVNIQGDEPFVQPEQISDIVSCFDDPLAEISTLIKRITTSEALFNPNNPKVVKNNNNEAIYFSRSTIPYVVNVKDNEWLNKFIFYEHLGLYGYKTDVLRKITKLAPSALEKSESLEQNRWIENGFRIKVAETEYENISIDTQEDLDKILKEGGF
ncbi:MAG: 3-deoxy-manno-octulosonate cytidylyltransferase [Bacteroidales bacterium]|nr:3-deoxy-manno-octulosonate cytidylyltransferase [Bacteroidales bacterium]